MPQKVEIRTPENIGLAYEVAGLGSRGAALILDTLLQMAALAGIILLFLAVTSALGGIQRLAAVGNSLSSWMVAGAILLAEVVYNGYFLLFESLWKGQTPGKKLVSIRVIMEDGRALSFRAALIRNLLRAADSLPGLYWPGIVVAFLNRDGRRIGDIAAGTVVVKLQRASPPAVQPPSALPPEQPLSSPLSLDVQQKAGSLNALEAEAIRHCIQRSTELKPEVSERLLASMAESIGQRLQLSAQEIELPAQEFLTEIVRAWDLRNAV